MKTEIIPVIHIVNEEQLFYNLKIVKDLGLNKVFLICHYYNSDQELIKLAKLVKTVNPDLWVGLNLLGYTTAQCLAMEELNEFDGLWCDTTINPELAKKVRVYKNVYFGALAFKYQPDEHDWSPEKVNNAILATDVATTSGSGTGKEADDTKVNEIRELLGSHPMAIASGVSIDNIHKYSGVVDYLLVATSITSTDGKELIIKEKLQELIDKNNGL